MIARYRCARNAPPPGPMQSVAGLAVRARGLRRAGIAEPALPAWHHGDRGNVVKRSQRGIIDERLQGVDMSGVLSTNWRLEGAPRYFSGATP